MTEGLWAAAWGVAAGVVASWLMFARNAVTRSEVSEMIRMEAPHAFRQELDGLREEMGELREEVAELTGVLKALLHQAGREPEKE